MSYEKKIEKDLIEKTPLPERLDIPMLKYFWLSSPLSTRRKEAIPYFLRHIHVLNNFSENELRLLSKFFHQRAFSKDEIIFSEGDSGLGFYFILSGHVEIMVKEPHSEDFTSLGHLERFDYFGELALLEENSNRSASAMAKDNSILLGIFKPDLEELIDYYPTVAAKLLQSISIIVANRLSLITNEMKILKEKLKRTENESN